jgi:hypothetical protein
MDVLLSHLQGCALASSGVERLMRSKTAFATALALWAESRERAIVEVSEKADLLDNQGNQSEAAYFRFVARLLTMRSMHERAQAAASGGVAD